MSAIVLLLVVIGVPIGYSDDVQPLQPPLLTHINDLRQLTPSEAAQPHLIQIKGVVTALSGWKNSFFLEESGYGISVDRTDSTEVHPGDEVEVWGKSGAGLFAPVIIANRVEALGHGPLPVARQVAYSDLVGGKEDSQWVEVQGIVHSAAISESWGHQVLFLHIDTGAGDIVARVHDFTPGDFSLLVDAAVRLQGVCGTTFNEKRQFVGLRIFVPDLSGIQIEQAPPADPFAVPESPIESLLQFGSPGQFNHRVKISGSVTYAKEGSFLYLQSGREGIEIETSTPVDLEPGTRIEALGFPAPGEYSPALQDAVVRRTGSAIAPAPAGIAAANVIQSKDGFLFAPYDGRLVQLDGELVSQIERQGEQVWYMRDGSTVFQADLETTAKSGLLPTVKDGDRLQLTGICVVETDRSREPRSFHVLLRSSSDLVVVGTRWWSASHSLWLIGLLIFICLAMFVSILQLRRGLVNHLPGVVSAASELPSRFILAAKRMGILGAWFALAVLIGGWACHIEILKTMQPGHIDMKANCALAVLFSGVPVWLNARAESRGLWCFLSRVCSAMTILIGLLTLLEYISGHDLRIDELLFRDNGAMASASGFPGRMAIPTAAAFVLLGCGNLLSRSRRGILIGQSLALITGVLCLLSTVGHLYGVEGFFGLDLHNGMALQTSLVLLLLSCALLFQSPARGLMITITSPSPGGIMARRFLPAAMLIPAALGWLRWQGQLKGLYGTGYGLALFALSNIAVFSLLIWANGWLLNRLDVERSNIESNLRESESRYRTVLESLPQMVWTCLPDGSCDYLSRQWIDYTGIPEIDQIGYRWAEQVHPEDRVRIKELWQAAVRSGKPLDTEYRVRDAEGGYRWFRALAVPLRDSDASVCKWFGTSADVEDKKLGEAEIRSFNESLEKRVRERTAQLGITEDALREKNLELERASKAKDQFLATVSHEIRTPMNAILGMADVLTESELDADQRRYVEVFRQAGANLMSLINDILDLSKIESGHLELERVEFDLADIIAQAVEVVGARARGKGIQLIVDSPPEVDTALIGDPTRLRQILINLLGNAVKFTEHGEVVLQVRNNTSGQPGHLDFSVTDTGIGIPSDKLETIFGDFTQADSSITRKYGGTGLGLGISRRLVELMGGRLTVNSSFGKGSTFRFTCVFDLTRPAPQALAEVKLPDEIHPAVALKILIAEDSPDNTLLFQIYLKSTPHQLTFAGDGQNALDKFKAERFDLVLMDIQMPGMDGLTATRAMRVIEHGHDLPSVPIIALTASARLEDIELSRLAGCNAHLSKPISKRTLLSAIEHYGKPLQTFPRSDTGEAIDIIMPEGLEDLVPEYLADRKTELPLLAACVARSDFERIRMLAHDLSGTGGSFGFDELTRLGAALESSARQADSAALKTQFAALESYLSRVQLSPPVAQSESS